MNAANILTGNLTVSFASLPRLGQLRVIEGHYNCGAVLAAKLLGSENFEDVVIGAELERGWAGISAGCARHREFLISELRA